MPHRKSLGDPQALDSPAVGSHLLLGTDAGGQRHFLAGEPVHCGTVLELYVEPLKLWLPVRYEASLCRLDPVVTFYLDLGDSVEEATVFLPAGALLRWPGREGRRHP